MRTAAAGRSTAAVRIGHSTVGRMAGQAVAGAGRLDWPHTLRVKRNQPLSAAHLRYRSVRARGALLHCVLLDCSASMLQAGRLRQAKAVLAEWAREVYRARDRLLVIGFSAGQACVLRDGHKAGLNLDWLQAVGAGGGSPLHKALETAAPLLRRARPRYADAPRNGAQRVVLSVLTDGRLAHLPDCPSGVDRCIVVDFDSGPHALGRARRLAQSWQAEYLHVDELVQPRLK